MYILCFITLVVSKAKGEPVDKNALGQLTQLHLSASLECTYYWVSLKFSLTNVRIYSKLCTNKKMKMFIKMYLPGLTLRVPDFPFSSISRGFRLWTRPLRALWRHHSTDRSKGHLCSCWGVNSSLPESLPTLDTL